MGRKNEFTDKDYEFDIRAIYDDPAEIQNNILLKYRKPVHWKVDTVNCNYLKIIVMI